MRARTREFYHRLVSDAAGDANAYTDYTLRDMYLERVTATLQTSAVGGTLTIRAPAVPGRAANNLFVGAITAAAGIDSRPYQLGQLNTTNANIADTSTPVLIRHGERLQVVGSDLNGNGTLSVTVSLTDNPQDLTR